MNLQNSLSASGKHQESTWNRTNPTAPKIYPGKGGLSYKGTKSFKIPETKTCSMFCEDSDDQKTY